MNCALSTIKCIVLVFNTICAIFGLVTAALCALAIGSLHNDHLTFCMFGVALGTIAFVISLFGCCGAQRESPCLMWAYATALICLLAIQLAAMMSLHAHDFVEVTTEGVDKLWEEEVEKPGVMAGIEEQFQCCGLHSWSDYPAMNLTVPPCCYEDSDNADPKLVYKIGCSEKLANVASYLGKVVTTINWFLTATEVVALLFACILAHNFRHQRAIRYISN